jgi:hypothetical protein
MHVTEKEVEELATRRNLNLEERKFQGRILIYRKFTDKPHFSAKVSQKSGIVEVKDAANSIGCRMSNTYWR